MSKTKQTLYQRILRVEKFYSARAINSERVNKIKRKILALKFNTVNLLN
jgi:hypothetical protein